MKYTLLQTFVILFFLLIFSIVDYGYIIQHDNIVSRIEDLTVIVFGHDWNMLEDLRSNLQNDPQVTDLILESNLQILSKMISEYDLPAADQILDIDMLPNMLRFRFDGDVADHNSYIAPLDSIKESSESIILISHDDDYANLFGLKETIALIRKILLTGTLVMLFFISLVIRINYVKKGNNFWNTYYQSGGRENRLKHFFLNLLISSLLPLFCLGILIYAAENYLSIVYDIPPEVWLMITGSILIAGLPAWLLTEKLR